jgi:hypothetical protein
MLHKPKQRVSRESMPIKVTKGRKPPVILRNLMELSKVQAVNYAHSGIYIIFTTV